MFKAKQNMPALLINEIVLTRFVSPHCYGRMAVKRTGKTLGVVLDLMEEMGIFQIASSWWWDGIFPNISDPKDCLLVHVISQESAFKSLFQTSERAMSPLKKLIPNSTDIKRFSMGPFALLEVSPSWWCSLCFVRKNKIKQRKALKGTDVWIHWGRTRENSPFVLTYVTRSAWCWRYFPQNQIKPNQTKTSLRKFERFHLGKGEDLPVTVSNHFYHIN